jgi:excisionase family DNA binding protein
LLQEGGPDVLEHCTATKETLACGRERRGGSGGVVRRPRFMFDMLLTIKEVSDWLNIKPSTLYLWAAQGKIPCRKIHGLIRFERDAILRWLDSFAEKQSQSASHILDRQVHCDVDVLIAAAKRAVYTPRHGGTRPKSGLIGKEETDGAV